MGSFDGVNQLVMSAIINKFNPLLILYNNFKGGKTASIQIGLDLFFFFCGPALLEIIIFSELTNSSL